MSRKIKIILLITLITVIGIIIFGFLIYNGIILLNNPSDEDYPIKGIDVSSYQGEIDWEVISSQDISFAFIKATEGSTFIDEKFAYNYEEAAKTDLPIGAYHFFSYDSSGKTQADNFINTVPDTENMLPPVVDLEFYGDYNKNPKDSEEVHTELNDMLIALEDHYGKKPIIYCTEKSYNLYIDGYYDDYSIWIRSVYTAPALSNDKWLFWQYSNRGKLEGYNGQEKFIDLNVFNGSIEEFEQYVRAAE